MQEDEGPNSRQVTTAVMAVPEILLPELEEWEEDGEGGAGRGKVRLVRSHAIRDSASPPPPGRSSPHQQQQGCAGDVVLAADQRSTVSGSEGGEAAIGELGDSLSVSDSGRGDTDTPDEAQYTDSTGIDLTQFIINTLNKHTKDRIVMLKLEQEMTTLVKDPKKSHHKFPHMSSYHRMLVHRVAAYFGLDHNVDQTGNCVIVNKTKNTRLPEMKFKDHIPEEMSANNTGPEPRKLILKRESCSCESGDRHSSDNSSRRSKSIEEREEEYERAKRRIFNEMMTPAPHYKYTINLGSTKGANQARSFDMRDTLRDSADRPQVSKSFSFGGYPAAQHLEPPRPGQKATPPTLIRGQVVWAVTDLTVVPKGSVLINPDTGTPYLNSDGSVYVFDPMNPPRMGNSGLEEGTVGSSSSLLLHQDMSKLSLEQQPQQNWVLQPRSPAPYILVNPLSPLPPHYVPYIYPGYQEKSSQEIATTTHLTGASGMPGLSLGPAQLAGLPPQPAALGMAPPPPPAPVPASVMVGQLNHHGQPMMVTAATPLHRPFLFSIHRSPSHSVVVFLQYCPAIYTRLQLMSLLDPLLCGRGQVQYQDPHGQWAEISALSPDTPVTNRFPIQIVFDNEDLATQAISTLKAAGLIPESYD